jgi:phosphonate dehydrogenase
MRPKVVLSHWVHSEVLALLGESCQVVANFSRESLARDERAHRAADAEALMVFMPDRLDEALLRRCPRLRIVAGAFKGHENFDVDACSRRGIWFTHVPSLPTVPPAELTIGLMIAVARKFVAGDRDVRTGQFRGWRPEHYGTGLKGRTCGILGMGAVGRAVAKRLSAFDMRLLYFDRRRLAPELEMSWGATRVDLDVLLERSDYVVTLLPLTPETRGIIDAQALRQMKPGSHLTNPGRGSLVHEEAVAASLRTGHLAGYAADVFEAEDWARADRPDRVPEDLIEATQQTCFTPHLGSAVEETRREVALYAATAILQALRGETPQGAVNEIESSPAVVSTA